MCCCSDKKRDPALKPDNHGFRIRQQRQGLAVLALHVHDARDHRALCVAQLPNIHSTQGLGQGRGVLTGVASESCICRQTLNISACAAITGTTHRTIHHYGAGIENSSVDGNGIEDFPTLRIGFRSGKRGVVLIGTLAKLGRTLGLGFQNIQKRSREAMSQHVSRQQGERDRERRY